MTDNRAYCPGCLERVNWCVCPLPGTDPLAEARAASAVAKHTQRVAVEGFARAQRTLREANDRLAETRTALAALIVRAPHAEEPQP